MQQVNLVKYLKLDELAFNDKKVQEEFASDFKKANNLERLEFKIASMNERVGDLNLTDGINCEICKNKGRTYLIVDDFEEVKDCSCLVKRKIHRQIKNSGLEKQFENQTLENYKVQFQWQKNILKLAVDFISDKSMNWFYMGGQVGSGKTHICTAISKELIESGKTFKYIRFTTDFLSLQKRLRSGYSDIREQAELELEELINVDVLYIDDLLKVRDLSNLFEVIDGRYVRNSITILSSELTLGDLGKIDAAIGTRIYEKTKHGNYVIEIERNERRNYRLKK